jgi:RND family efflux transporter MFP subunit
MKRPEENMSSSESDPPATRPRALLSQPGSGDPSRSESGRRAPEPPPPPDSEQRRLGLAIVIGVAALVAGVVGLYLRSVARENHQALASLPKPVSTARAKSEPFQPTRSYVGTILPWIESSVGPQYVSAYTGTVLVRPGATVKRGEVLATLDCRDASAQSKQTAAQARAIAEKQSAVEHEAARLKQLTQGGFASDNEVEQLQARAASEQAEAESLRASLVSRNLQVDDCVLRAPFAGEVADRFVDPGTFVRPGTTVVKVIDRRTVRVVADVPESDFDVVTPGTSVRLEVLSTGARLAGAISRRTPAADESTRTVHFEVDLPNGDHKLPVGTTARLTISVGKPQPAVAVPLQAATIRGDQATLYVIKSGIARRAVVPVLGEAGGKLYVDPTLGEGAEVVVEGRALLDDGDRVAAKEIAKAPGAGDR